jgi:hypothetical protein
MAPAVRTAITNDASLRAALSHQPKQESAIQDEQFSGREKKSAVTPLPDPRSAIVNLQNTERVAAHPKFSRYFHTDNEVQ